MFLSKTLKEPLFPKVAAILLLGVLFLIGSAPGYLSGKWEWKEPPTLTTIKELRKITKSGLEIPGWQTIEQEKQQIGEHKWSVQKVQRSGSKTQPLVLLLPQDGIRKQPQVEWVDVASQMGWEIAQLRTVEFTASPPQKSPAKVKARYFRAATKSETFAVLQWYAWQEAGDPSPIAWFVADQAAQLRKQRRAWTAVSVVMPMEQLGQIDREWDKIRPLAESVQSALMNGKL